MSLSLINEIWKLLKTSIEAGDTDGAAETLVNYLVEEDYSPAEIKQTFRGDKDIKDALDFFMETPDDGLYHEQSDDDFFDDIDLDDYDEDEEY
jgi:hypothetical protein